MDIRTTSTVIAVGLAISLTLLGCSSGSDRSTSTQTAVTVQETGQARNYSGPGSKWDVVLNDDATFLIERRATAQTEVVLRVSGNYQSLDNGFTQFFVSSAQGEDAPAPGATAWGIEVPGFALFLKPDDSPFGGFISMLDSGTCPSEPLLANWVVVKPQASADATDAAQPIVGAFEYDPSTSQADLTQRYSLQGDDLGVASLGAASCSDGILITDEAVVYLTAAGGGLAHTIRADEADREVVFALQQEAISSIGDLDGDYVGLVYDPGNPSGNNVSPTVVNCAAGICSGNILSALDVSASVAEFSLNLFGTLDQPVQGLIAGEVSNDAGRGDLVCQVLGGVGASSNMLVSCVGQDPENPSQQINLIMRSQ